MNGVCVCVQMPNYHRLFFEFISKLNIHTINLKMFQTYLLNVGNALILSLCRWKKKQRARKKHNQAPFSIKNSLWESASNIWIHIGLLTSKDIVKTFIEINFNYYLDHFSKSSKAGDYQQLLPSARIFFHFFTNKCYPVKLIIQD